MKKQYLQNKEMGDINALEKFLSNMGHNVKTAAQTGKVTEYQETRSQEAFEEHEDPDVSNWIPIDEISVWKTFLMMMFTSTEKLDRKNQQSGKKKNVFPVR